MNYIKKIYYLIIINIKKIIYFKNNNKIYVLGDSHTDVFKYINSKLNNKFIFDVLRIGGATCQGMTNPNSKTNALQIFENKIKKIKNKNSKLIFMLGEVDCGFVIWYRSQKYKIDIKEQLKNSLNNYFSFILKIKKMGFKNIIICGAHLPTILDGENKGMVANARKDVKANLIDRTKLTLEFNSKLKELSNKNHIKYISITNNIIDKNTGVINYSFLNNDKTNHHIPSNKIYKYYINLLNKL